MVCSVLPSLRQPESIHPSYYFSSQTFINQAQADVENLVKAFQSQTTHHQSQGPFLTFKSCYHRLGWSYIHLSVVDPALRSDWFKSIIRLFLNYLKPEIDSTLQIATFFALWCFYGSQPDLLGNKFHIILDLTTYRYLLRLPDKLGDHLDALFGSHLDQVNPTLKTSQPSQPSQTSTSLSTSLSKAAAKHQVHLDPSLFSDSSPTTSRPLKPSDSLHQTLAHLLSQHAFVIQPEQTALLHPALPTNKLVLDQILHHVPPPPQLKPKPGFGDQIVATEDELARWAHSAPPDDELKQMRLAYLSTKGFLTDGHVPVTTSILREAIGMTRKVIQKTGPGLDHLLFSPLANGHHDLSGAEIPLDSAPAPGLEAVLLVDGGEGVTEWDEAVDALKANVT